MKACIFPGQGSQKKGMGETLFDRFQSLTTKADAVLGYSIKNLCLNDPDKRLTQTEYTQPALYVVNALSWMAYLDDNAPPAFVAGHSLGEYNALFAAGAFDFETGLRLVCKRGRLMAQAGGGAMAAVIGADERKITEILKKNSLTDVDIANYNSPDQLVISGTEADIKAACSAFRSEGVKLFIPLKVSGAFHSHYMLDTAGTFSRFLEEFTFFPLRIPVISNAEARPYQDEHIKSLLSRQITSPVLWTSSIQYLINQGVTEFEETGPGKVLTGLVKKIKDLSSPHSHLQHPGR